MNLKGNIILFPCPIADGNISSLSAESVQLLHGTTCFVVEKAKTARHFIKATNHPIAISQLEILEISDDKKEMEDFLEQHLTEKNIGIISEAGCPGIADPGADVVAWAHKNQVRVIPQAGPSSIFMAMMSSGMNGQNFAFNGYLSNKKPELIQQLKALEQKFQKNKQTQIWMETPYRNGFMTETMFQTLPGRTRLCIACDINAPTEEIRTMYIDDWKKIKTDHLHKRPCIFLMG